MFSICRCARLSLYFDNIGCGSAFVKCENNVFHLPLRSPFAIFVSLNQTCHGDGVSLSPGDRRYEQRNTGLPDPGVVAIQIRLSLGHRIRHLSPRAQRRHRPRHFRPQRRTGLDDRIPPARLPPLENDEGTHLGAPEVQEPRFRPDQLLLCPQESPQTRFAGRGRS